MRIIEPTFEVLDCPPCDDILSRIERAGRTAYKSEDRIDGDSARKFVAGIVKKQHHSVLEHCSVSVLFTVDRGVSHELVRHRLASYTQESTRYCSYDKGKFGSELTFIRPVFWPVGHPNYDKWLTAMQRAEDTYMAMLHNGASAQEARSVLPNSLKTDVVMTTNLREWHHVLVLRTSMAAHPQMRQVMNPFLGEMQRLVPVVFDDIIAGA